MPKVSVNILTKDRFPEANKALDSISFQSYTDYEVITINDGLPFPKEGEAILLKRGRIDKIKIFEHPKTQGITLSRQEALEKSSGEYIAILDDDDRWVDRDKLKKQVEFLDQHPEVVLVGGGIQISNIKYQISKFRPSSDAQIRKTMLLRNNFFTSTVMFRKSAAIQAGGFVKDEIDLAEDYDLWLRMGKLGQIHNFQEVFAAYRQSPYNKERFKQFLQKQLKLVNRHKNDYPYYLTAKTILEIRLVFNF